MIDLTLLTENPELAKNVKLEVTGADLLAFGETIHKNAIAAGKRQVPLLPAEEYLTAEQLSKLLNVSLVTLWSWDKKGITTPLRIGNSKRYRRSDVEKFLTQEG